MCPITGAEWTWRARVQLVGTTTQGFIMIEQLKSLDCEEPGSQNVTPVLLDDVKSRIATMLDL